MSRGARRRRRRREFLEYCEERRKEHKRSMEDETDRKLKAEGKTASWELFRISVNFLKQNGEKWRTRKIEECDRIRAMEKEERMSIIQEKRKRYGLKTLNKEENGRLKERTSERIEIAQAKSNYWKWFRDGGEEVGGGTKDEERREQWKTLKRKLMELEEDGDWIVKEDRLPKMGERMVEMIEKGDEQEDNAREDDVMVGSGAKDDDDKLEVKDVGG